MTAGELAGHLARGGRKENQAAAAIRNWQKGQFTPQPSVEDVQHLAQALGVEVQEISEWRASYRYAPMSARKVRLVTQLIDGRDVQDALDVLKFTSKRAAESVRKVLQSAIANAGDKPTLFAKHLPNNIRIKIASDALTKKKERKDNDPKGQIRSKTLPKFRDFLDDNKKRYLKDLMSQTDNNIQEACRISGLSRSSLYEYLKKYKTQ